MIVFTTAFSNGSFSLNLKSTWNVSKSIVVFMEIIFKNRFPFRTTTSVFKLRWILTCANVRMKMDEIFSHEFQVNILPIHIQIQIQTEIILTHFGSQVSLSIKRYNQQSSCNDVKTAIKYQPGNIYIRFNASIACTWSNATVLKAEKKSAHSVTPRSNIISIEMYVPDVIHLQILKAFKGYEGTSSVEIDQLQWTTGTCR